MPLPYVTMQVKRVPRELWAWVSAQAIREGREKGEIVIAVRDAGPIGFPARRNWYR